MVPKNGVVTSDVYSFWINNNVSDSWMRTVQEKNEKEALYTINASYSILNNPAGYITGRIGGKTSINICVNC
jgi:hypothetical protein